uniref:Uncharacterized protein n=1 Tax=Salix viminalis TaxID=40686 RepID=A0A6N2K354_SALVM
MSTPGAAISGCRARRKRTFYSHIYPGRTGFAFRIFLEREEGPLDEKYATVGAGLYCDTTVLGRIVATGFLGNYKIYQEIVMTMLLIQLQVRKDRGSILRTNHGQREFIVIRCNSARLVINQNKTNPSQTPHFILLIITTFDSNLRSMVVAATVRIQGATFVTVSSDGPSFPPEQTTVIPFSTAWNAPMAIGSSFGCYMSAMPDRISWCIVESLIVIVRAIVGSCSDYFPGKDQNLKVMDKHAQTNGGRIPIF